MNYSNLSYPQSNKDEVDILKTIKNINKEFPNMSTDEILKIIDCIAYKNSYTVPSLSDNLQRDNVISYTSNKL